MIKKKKLQDTKYKFKCKYWI